MAYLHKLCWIQIFMFGLTNGFNLDYDLKKLSQMLPGVYSNKLEELRNPLTVSQQQYLTSATSSAKMPLSAMYKPVEVTFLSDAYNVYVEHTLNQDRHPHRQWLYSFSTDPKSRSIRLKVYTFHKNSLKEKIRRNPRSLKYISASDVMTRDECDMYWRRLANIFIATTSKKCVADVNEQRVRISVVITLNQTSLQIDEGWYKVKDGGKVLEMDGPVVLVKLNSLADDSLSPYSDGNEEVIQHTPKDAEAEQALQQDRRVKRRHGMGAKNSNFLPRASNTIGVTVTDNKITDLSANDVEEKYITKDDQYRYAAIEKLQFNHILERNTETKGKKVKKSGKNSGYSSWNIQTYNGVIDALLSGHKLYMTVNMKKCSHSDRHVKNRVIFGDYVDVFRIGKDFDHKQAHSFVELTVRKLVHTHAGFTEVLRHVTTFRNGTVRILTAQLAETGEIERQSTAYCTLQDQDTRRGDVRFYLNPLRDVTALDRYGSLRAALKKGKMVRIVADLARCGGGGMQHGVVSAELRAYDINKRSIEFSIKDTRLVQDPNDGKVALEEQYTMFELTKPSGGVVTLHTRQPSSRARKYSVVSGFVKLRCETERNSSTRAILLFNT